MFYNFSLHLCCGKSGYWVIVWTSGQTEDIAPHILSSLFHPSELKNVKIKSTQNIKSFKPNFATLPVPHIFSLSVFPFSNFFSSSFQLHFKNFCFVRQLIFHPLNKGWKERRILWVNITLIPIWLRILSVWSVRKTPPPFPVTRVTRMWGGAGLINLGQCSRPHMAETSALVTETLV